MELLSAEAISQASEIDLKGHERLEGADGLSFSQKAPAADEGSAGRVPVAFDADHLQIADLDRPDSFGEETTFERRKRGIVVELLAHRADAFRSVVSDLSGDG